MKATESAAEERGGEAAGEDAQKVYALEMELA